MKIPVQALLYLLMRDHVLPGDVEKLMRDVETICTKPVYSNKFLAGYAMSLVKRLEAVK